MGSDGEPDQVGGATKAIHDTLRRIEQLDPDLGAHLRHSVRTGMFCAYLPDPRAAISWSTSAR